MTAVEARPEPVAAAQTAEPGPPASWFGLCLAILGGILGAGALADNSFLTHLATGRLILDSGVPHVDPYAFTTTGEPWVVSSWGASWLYAVAENVGGLLAVRILVAAATAVTVGFVWRLTAPARGVLVRVGIVAVIVVLSGGWFSERPQIFAFVAVSGLLVVLRERRSPWWLVPAGLLWVNVHASWPLGLALLGLWVGALLVDDRSVDRHAVRCAATFAAGVFMGAVLSPYGLTLLRFPIDMLSRVDTLQYIKEWRRPSPGDPDLWILAAAMVGAMLLAARARRWGTALAIMALALPVAMGVRNIPLAAMMLATLAAPLLAGLGDERIGPVPSRRWWTAGAAVGASAIAALVLVTPDLDLTPYPVAAFDQLEARGADLSEARVLTPDYVGNYLEFRDGAGANVWHDDRAEIIPHEVFDDYVTLLSDDVQADVWTDIVNRYEFDAIVWPADDTFGRWLEEDGAIELVAGRYAVDEEPCLGGLEPVWSSQRFDADWVVAVRTCASVGF